MGSLDMSTEQFPFLDLSPFEGADAGASSATAKELVTLCHEYGFVGIRGHGLPSQSIVDGFRITREFFALPNDVKMKAPHPPTPKPHRGFSGLSVEKVYSEKDMEVAGNDASIVRQIKDFKESYEIGAEQNCVEPNIWIPDEAMPTFKPYMLRLYDELDKVASRLMRALTLGLDIEASEHEEFSHMNSHIQNQMRLLYYPAVSQSELGKTVMSRLPTHTDFSAFTMLFQDKTGGLEFRHPKTDLFSSAEETDDVLFLNIGTMLQHLTNDFFIAAEHRVTVPSDSKKFQSGLTARYSIPYFVCPRHDDVIKPLGRFITPSTPAKYEPIRYDEHAARITKFQYTPPSD